MLLIAAHAAAQNQTPNKIPGEVHDETQPAEGNRSTFARPASLPDAPAAHRVIDKKFIAVMSALGGAESLGFTSRKLVLDREFAAGVPWVTSVPSNQHIVAKDLALYGSEFLVAYELKKSHSWLPGDRVIRRLWWAYPAAMTAIHVKNAIGNIRTQGPGGCSTVECVTQMQ